MRLLIIMFLLFSTSTTWAKSTSTSTAQTKSNHINNTRQPSQILPLDAETERVLKASALASEVVEDDANQKMFHRKVYQSSQKIASLISLDENERLSYVYDCLFMVEEGFFLKYSNLPKEKLILTRKIVIESFEK